MRRALAAMMVGGLVSAGCGGREPWVAPSPAPSTIESSIPTAAAPTAMLVQATATPDMLLSIEDLPRVELRDIHATAICDPEPGLYDLDAGETTIDCTDGIALAVAVVRTVTQDPVIRLYLQRPKCASIPCSDDELSTAVVTAWTATLTLAIGLDSRLGTVPPTSIVDDAAWPTVGDEPPPAVKRSSIKGAPREVADRDPYPFCGRVERGDPLGVRECFRDGVLAGRPVEMIERLYGTEGDEFLRICRFDGGGRVVWYQRDGRAWGRIEGAMHLGATPPAWSLDPWDGTEEPLA